MESKLLEMESIRIDILNPKAKRLLKNLADLNLIKIHPDSSRVDDFSNLLKKFRGKSETAPTADAIQKDVEEVRKSRNAG